METLFFLVPLAAVLALVFAYIFYRQMQSASEGTPTMQEIAEHVRKGAMAYLRQQYKVVAIVFAILALFFAVLPRRAQPTQRVVRSMRVSRLPSDRAL